MPIHPKAEELIKEFEKLIEEADNAFNEGYDELREYLNSDKNKLFESFPYPENPYELEPDKIKSFIISAFNLGRESGIAEEMETIICSAILTEGGAIIRGHRHHDAIRTAEAMGLERIKLSDAQGFITSKNRYVNRKEAMLIQKSAGIVSASPAGYLGDELYSEDLY